MLNAATLSAVGDYVSLLGGKNSQPASVAESPMLQFREDSLDLTLSGVYTGVQIQLYGRRPDGTEASMGAAISPANNSTSTTTQNFAPGTYGGIRAKLLGISSGSILASLNSTKSGSNAAPGAAAFKWPPVGPVAG